MIKHLPLRNYKKILFLFFLPLFAKQLAAQVSITNSSPTVSIDFSSSMPTQAGTSFSTAFSGAGFSPDPTNTTSGRLNSKAWSVMGWSDGDLSFGGSNTSGDYARGTATGPVTIGGIYAYSAASGLAANPTLMIQPSSGDFAPGAITLRVVNSGNTIITALDVSYNIFVRNDQGRSSSFNFSYSTDNFINSDFPVPALDYSTAPTADALGWVQVGGAPSRATTITGISLSPGSFIYLRWSSYDLGGTGSRDEIGLDDINLTATYSGPCTAPTTQATINGFSGVLSTQLDLSYTRGNGSGGLLVVGSTNPTLTANPVNGNVYSANSNFGNGDALGGGFVLYNGPGNGAGNAGTFTVTGLAPSITYYFFVFEYGVSVPCYLVPGNTASRATAGGSATLGTDYFRSRASGAWNNSNTWESSHDNMNWMPATIKPGLMAKGILVRAPHTVTITSNETARLLTVSAGSILTYSNGAAGGYDLDITDDPSDIDLKIFGTYILFGNAATLQGEATAQVFTGAVVRVDQNAGTNSSDDFARNPAVSFATGSVFEWNTTTAFQTSNAIYFPNAGPADIASFRVLQNVAPVGANSITEIKGMLELVGTLTLQNPGTKVFRNGISGSGALNQSSACPILIDGTSAILGGSGAINLYAGGSLTIAATATTNLMFNKAINNGVFFVDGGLFCSTYILSGSSSFVLGAGATLGIGSPNGISALPATTGNIQLTGGRSFNGGANYLYNSATANQVTGNGLPATIVSGGSLTIANTALPGNNTVTLTTTNTSVPVLNLVNGLFECGASRIMKISNGGTINGMGGHQGQSTGAGTIWFTGSGAINPGGGLSLTNLRISNGVMMGGANTVINGIFEIAAGGFVSGPTAPTYSSNPPSTLYYNTAVNYGVGNEWATNRFGTASGVPHHVMLAAGSSTNFGASNAPREMRGDLTINNSSTFALSTAQGGDLNIGGNWVRNVNGNFNHNGRAVVFVGDNNSSVKATGGETFATLIINKSSGSGTITLVDDIKISKELTVTSGTLDLGEKNITLLSTASQTASFGKVGAAGTVAYSGAGRFIVERFIPTGTLTGQHMKSWQFLAVPSNGGQTINQAWQEGTVLPATGTAGYGTIITNNVSGSGFDIIGGTGPSMKTFDAANTGWVGVPNTMATELYQPKGYMIFVRGDRTVSTYNSPATTTNLRSKGKLFVPGTNPPPVTTVAAGKFESIGNPYACTIDFLNVNKTGAVDEVFYVWDPLLPGTYNLGGFQTISSTNGYRPNPGGTANYNSSTAYTKIQSGQAFLVHSTGGGGSVGFTEDAKVSGSDPLFRPAPASPFQFLRAELYTSAGNMADANVVAYSQRFDNGHDKADAIKIMNQGENFGIASNQKTFAIEARQSVMPSDSIHYQLSNLRAQNYQLRFGPENFTNSSVKAYLYDRYLQTKTPVSLQDSTFIDFTVTTDPATYASNRFVLVFNRARLNERNDQDVPRTITKAGIESSADEMYVYPNPVVGRKLTLYSSQAEAGKASVQLISSTGQGVFTTSLMLQNRAANYSIQLPTLPAGSYSLKLTETSGRSRTVPVLIK